MRSLLSPRRFFRSLDHAWRGVRLTFRTEHSFRVDVAAALVVLGCGVVFPLERWARALLVVVTMFVMVLELVNSSVERLVDLLRPRLDETARDVKDVMAAAVLIASVGAFLVGCWLIGPFFIERLGRL